jgi:hypothetical protein
LKSGIPPIIAAVYVRHELNPGLKERHYYFGK